VLEISQINQFYGGSHTLWDAQLSVPAGGCVCLMGRNGVGKTTLLKVIMGLLPARSGSLKFDGKEMVGLKPEKRARLGIGYVPQGREIFPNLTVQENLRMGLLGSRRNGHGGGDPLEHVFELFPKLQTLLGRKGGVLSGGEQQQLAIARVLLARPKLLLMDEPTEGIQPSVIDQIEETIERIKGQGISVLLVEQYLEFAWRLASAYAIMRKGTIVSRGSTKDLREDMVRQHLTV